MGRNYSRFMIGQRRKKIARTALPAISALLFAGTMAGVAPGAWSAELYRYTNDDGNLVIAYQVPPEAVANGYEVLNAKGVVVRVVAPTLDEDERASRSEQQRAEALAEEERERLREWDETLLLRYSTVEDIEAARDRALRDLRIRVSILKGKLRSLKQQIENYQALAADQERMGNKVNDDHLQAIKDLRSEIVSTERAVDDRQREIAQVDAEYGRDITRFTKLLDIVEMRRSMAVGDESGES